MYKFYNFFKKPGPTKISEALKVAESPSFSPCPRVRPDQPGLRPQIAEQVCRPGFLGASLWGRPQSAEANFFFKTMSG